MEQDLNRIKLVLVEKKKTGCTVSRWAQNTSQPDLETIHKIATILGVDPRVLITGNEEFGVKL